ncbi:MAG: DUF5689 domain-containing protein [Flavobacteriales bacterium]
MNTYHKFFATSLTLITLAFSSCKKEFDSPPPRTIPVGNILTVAELRALYVDQNVRITGDSSVFAVVTADEQSGNLFRNVYVEDNTGAINLRLNTSGGLYEGDSIRIYLKGTTVSRFNGMLQLDSVDVDRNIIKQAVGRFRQPVDIDLTQVNSSMQSRLIRLTDVQFTEADMNRPYADAVNLQSVNRSIQDCNGNSTIVRSSGFAGFASQLTPTGKGSMIAIVGEFNGTMQLYIRRTSEVNMTQERCGGGTNPQGIDVLNESFLGVSNNTDFNAFGWINISTQGSRVWRGRIFNEDRYIQANSFQSTDPANESWLITPAIINSPTKKLRFKSAVAFYTHQGLTVLISTNYTGGNPTNANWTTITAPIAGASNSNYQWVDSGDVPLFGYLPEGYEGNFHIAFRYNGSGPNGQTGTVALDDISVTN